MKVAAKAHGWNQKREEVHGRVAETHPGSTVKGIVISIDYV
jgi:hypothetical protein